MIVDGGPVGIGVESTIVDVTEETPVLLRPGAITMEMLHETVGTVEIDPAIAGGGDPEARPKAPGMKYRHYAPRAELTLVEDKEWEGSKVSAKVIETIKDLVRDSGERGRKAGIICTDETKHLYQEGAVIRSLGRRDKEETIARSLFGVLREFDSLDVDDIYSESFLEDHLGQAIMNRLKKQQVTILGKSDHHENSISSHQCKVYPFQPGSAQPESLWGAGACQKGRPDIRIEIGEYTINHQTDHILQDIYKRKPDMVGFSCYIWNITYVRQLAGDLVKVLPKVRIWLGGPEVSYDAETILAREPAVEGVMVGEGERTLRN